MKKTFAVIVCALLVFTLVSCDLSGIKNNVDEETPISVSAAGSTEVVISDPSQLHLEVQVADARGRLSYSWRVYFWDSSLEEIYDYDTYWCDLAFYDDCSTSVFTGDFQGKYYDGTFEQTPAGQMATAIECGMNRFLVVCSVQDISEADPDMVLSGGTVEFEIKVG